MVGRWQMRVREYPWLVGLFLVASAGLGGCASTQDCVSPEFERPFGQRFAHFFGMIANVPTAIAEDNAVRSRYLGWNMGNAGRRFKKEVATTAAHPFPNLIQDARDRWPSLTASVWDLGADVGEDFRCAVPRVWHELKLLE